MKNCLSILGVDFDGNIFPNAMYAPSPDEEIIKARSLYYKQGMLQPLTLCFDQLDGM